MTSAVKHRPHLRRTRSDELTDSEISIDLMKSEQNVPHSEHIDLDNDAVALAFC